MSKAISPHGPSTLFSDLFPDSLASDSRASNGFLMNNPIVFIVENDNRTQIYFNAITVANEFTFFV